MFDLSYAPRRSRGHRFPTADSLLPYVYGDYSTAYNGFGNFRGGGSDWDRSTLLAYEGPNSIEDATRAHVAAKADWEKAKEKHDEAQKKLEESEKKLKECEDRLRAAKQYERYH
ncbi:hypothetical protein IAQ61_000567 [Plenodomus lingam]|uniref:Uncharacterized protein n=1 Tax=Leptosphaeria maculans (strain JN3 / isolate v23.1.3 / race Av1-4-5-6-7-8) TaxID=985895 RepID=E5A6Q4_LEPMJ|nr:predicted protein [Plenodomus lingam JN3]KAH9880278.1 hypothetical protein IAQ61_000567 [Plenodomus lingam]CBX99299.1 predicted protein [Plenodomus lingam JN3]